MADVISFTPLHKAGNSYTINRKVPFSPSVPLKWETVQVAYDFAYNMTFGNRGEHRDHRSGGMYSRKPGEIFKDTFQGKLAECALYNVLCKRHKITLPSFDVWKLGQWDMDDFLIDNERASVKSTKAYGNLLLLETKDFSEDGSYIPNADNNGGKYDYFVLVRMDPFCEDIMKKNRLLYADTADYNELKDIIIGQSWKYDVPGYITRQDLQQIISKHLLIPRGAMLNGKTRLDAENYYIQAGDLRPIDTL